jgi:ABC-2 type transport system ATP-binding protein
VIEFREVGHTYRSLTGKRVRAVEEFTLVIPRGEVFGLAGPNGAGKSTLISLMLGYMAPTDGDLRIDSAPPRAWVERHGIGYLSELVNIKPSWKLEGALRRFAILAGVPAAEVNSRAEAVIALLGVGEHRDKKVRQLSKGNLQRLGLAQALLHDEQVLILDEPTHGLDPVWTQRFRDIVDDLRRPERVIFIASHNLDELQRLADRVAIIDRGRLQRVVSMRESHGSGARNRYRLVVAAGAGEGPVVFSGARPVSHDAGGGLPDGAGGGAEFDLPELSTAELNEGVARLIGSGALIVSLAPRHSALEQQFREAVGDQGDLA